MIRYLFSGLLLLGVGLLTAQSNKLQTYNALSARVLAIDHNIPNEAFDGLSQTFALELGYRRQFGKYFGVAIPLKIGIIDVGQLENISIAGVEVLPQFYPLGTEGRISPYLHTGYGIVTERFDDANHQIPLGLGFNFKLEANSWFGIQGEYRLSDQNLRDNVMVGLGYIYRLSSIDTDGDGIVNRNDRCPTLPGPAATGGCPDADQDGITDAEDRCPNQPGLATLAGCPDTDQDGLPDQDDACPDLAGPASLKGCPDTDEDGVPDPDDRCPQQAGLPALQGCPDQDGDGVADDDDRCPQQAGPASLKGCPDQDADGVPDELDRCPDQPGNLSTGCPDRDADGFADQDDDCPDTPGKFKGCPDSDGDGLADNVDRCPTTPGPAASGGCPAVEQKVQERLEYAARAVQFESGSATLKESSYVILSEIAGIMRQYPSYHLSINGHTDNVGSDVRNLALSQERALACRKFLIATGIEEGRISSAGFGDSRPLQSNDTAEGRRLNRRVEFSLQPRE
ncbi:OmpA family protein [Neolewinella lacunae]|uniref:OmpA family protein n=1 Tax=Neolewinella lacunae TaxID=1517758 RepID=A0A923PK79_9BACT|nr:OmpA family protein [Neolewinella lacunae]MBC6994206.1 OmpA family protein [Neolewinella lacunae]MDN3634635.1 OmpA family protein [Neolewinella lacunae]